MRRRPPKAETPLNQKQEELAQRESRLRGEMEKLERMIAEAPRVAEETTRRQREELLARASEGRSRLDVSIALAAAAGFFVPRFRKRPVFVWSLGILVVWLVSHLHF